MRVVIEIDQIPKKQLLDCRADLQRMLEEFTEKHPDIIIPCDAVRIEGDFFGLHFQRGIFR